MHSRIVVVLVAVISVSLVAAATAWQWSREEWPEQKVSADMQLVASRVVAQWIGKPPTHLYKYKHSPTGLYLHRGPGGLCRSTKNRPLNEDGIPMLVWNGKPHYHPSLTAQCGLAAFNFMLLEKDDRAGAVVAKLANNLIALQNDKGAFEFPFAWHHYLSEKDLPPGWTSALSQGKGLSLLTRAYTLTGDQSYLEAGRKALAYLLTPTSEGGVMTSLADLDPSLSNYVFFEEYVSDPANYVLNGYIFALIGLYDWSSLPSSVDANQDTARDFFDRGVKTLTHILPYYDLGNITSYDLGYITFGKRSKVRADYHLLHILQLNALYGITGEMTFKRYAEKWYGYMQNPTIPTRIKRYMDSQ